MGRAAPWGVSPFLSTPGIVPWYQNLAQASTEDSEVPDPKFHRCSIFSH